MGNYSTRLGRINTRLHECMNMWLHEYIGNDGVLCYNFDSMSRNNHYADREYVPEKCWVGDTQKISYATREEAEVAARVAEYEYRAPELSVYKCGYGEHWHLSSRY